MKERRFSNIILILASSVMVYFILNKPYGITIERVLGVFGFLFLLWAIDTNYKNALKEEGA